MNTAKMKDTDTEMLQKLQANKNDKDALLAIFDRYSTEVYSLALIKISERMPTLIAEDAAQEVLVCVFASLQVNCDLIETPTSLCDYLMASAGRAVDQYIVEQQTRISTL